MHRRSLLMRSPLSRFLTPADTSQCSRFFRVWWLFRSPGPNRSLSVLRSGDAKLPSFSAFDESCCFGYAPAASSCEGANCVGHVPPQPPCDHRFRGSKPRLTPRSAVGFFGSGGCVRSPGSNRSPGLLRISYVLLLSFSAFDESQFTGRLQNVNAQGLCNRNKSSCEYFYSQMLEFSRVPHDVGTKFNCCTHVFHRNAVSKV